MIFFFFSPIVCSQFFRCTTCFACLTGFRRVMAGRPAATSHSLLHWFVGNSIALYCLLLILSSSSFSSIINIVAIQKGPRDTSNAYMDSDFTFLQTCLDIAIMQMIKGTDDVPDVVTVSWQRGRERERQTQRERERERERERKKERKKEREMHNLLR